MTILERRHGDTYQLTSDEVERFVRDGYVHLKGVLSEDEVAEIEVTYDRFLRQEIRVDGKDFCDMAGDYGREVDDFSIVNVMLPRKYHEPWKDNIYERRAASIAARLCGPGMELDYDQLLAKRPFKEDAVFAWHQDMAYWIETRDTRTATCWLAVDDSTVDNGCMRFVPGSHHEPIRPHRPLHEDRSISHTLCTDVDDSVDQIRDQPISRGDITVHNERVLHGSGGNSTEGWRRAYVVAFRTSKTVERERALGFTHSHNDDPDILRTVGPTDS
ncbi:MAG: phytanoyl-CoA dioxygenase family protein [Acidimicrobiales bacterium]